MDETPLWLRLVAQFVSVVLAVLIVGWFRDRRNR